MSTVRDFMGNPWWASTYNRYNFQDPSNENYGHFATSGRHTPLTIDSNPYYTIQLDRHGHGADAYNIGAVNSYVKRSGDNIRIDVCSDVTGAPNICARKYLGDRVDFAGNPRYDRLG